MVTAGSKGIKSGWWLGKYVQVPLCSCGLWSRKCRLWWLAMGSIEGARSERATEGLLWPATGVMEGSAASAALRGITLRGPVEAAYWVHGQP